MGTKKRLREEHSDGAGPVHHHPAKKSRVFSEQDKRLAAVFDHLADDVGDVRIEAAKDLLALLAESSSDGDRDGGVDAKKVVRRLVKGLCSSRKAARLGFFVALTEVLRQTCRTTAGPPDSPFSRHEIVSLAVDSTEPDGNASGQEKRDYLLGRVAACNAILLSRILEEPAVATVELTNVLEILSSLARGTTWLREECGNVLFTYVQSLDAARADSGGKLVLDALAKHDLLKTPEGVAVWVALRPRVDPAVLPKHIWKNEDPLHSKNWHSVAVVLRTGGASVADDRQKGGASQPEPSFAWLAVIAAFVAASAPSTSLPEAQQARAVDAFWTEVVDNNLFTQSASQEKKGWGFAVLAAAVTRLPGWALPSLFSPNLMKTLVNQRADVNRYLHSAALVPLSAIKKRAAQEPSVAPKLLAVLLSIPDITNFDQVTKTKTLEALVSAAYTDGILLEIASTLCNSLLGLLPASTDEQELRRSKGRVGLLFDLSVLLVRHHQVYVDDDDNVKDWVKKVLLESADLAFQHQPTQAGSEAPAAADVSRLARTRLQACLSIILNSGSGPGTKCARLVVSRLFERLVKPKNAQSSLDLDKAVRRRLKSSYEQLEKHTSSDSAAGAVSLLHALTLLEVLDGEASALAMLDDIDPLYNSLAEGSASDEDGDHSVTLTEILLSFVSKPPTLYRKLAETVFTSIATSLTAPALQVLVEVLDKPETLSGQQELFDQEPEAEDGDGDDDGSDDGDGSEVEAGSGEESSDVDTEDSLDSDVEVVDARLNGDASNSDSDGADSGSDSDAGTDEAELLKLDAVLAETLGTAGRLDGGDADSDSDSDADMDDEQMMALEPALTKIFQERRKAETGNKKQDRKDARENMVNFKNRVLDLLHIYVKREHANALAMDLILPLLALVRTSSTRTLSDKAAGVLRAYFDASKGKTPPALHDAEPAFELLAAVHDAAGRGDAKAYAAACSRASLFVARVLLAADPAAFDRIEDVYSATVKRRHRRGKRSKIQRSFFLDWTNYAYDLAR